METETSIGAPTKSFTTVTHMSARSQPGAVGRAPQKPSHQVPVLPDPEADSSDDEPIEAITSTQAEEFDDTGVGAVAATDKGVGAVTATEVVTDTALEVEERIPEAYIAPSNRDAPPKFSSGEDSPAPKFSTAKDSAELPAGELPAGPTAGDAEIAIANLDYPEDTSIFPAPLVLLSAVELILAVIALVFTAAAYTMAQEKLGITPL